MAIVAMSFYAQRNLLNSHYLGLYNDILEHLPYRLSRRFRMTITLKLWLMSLRNPNRHFIKFLYSFLHYAEIGFATKTNRILRFIANLKDDLPIEEHIDSVVHGTKKFTKFQKFINNFIAPEYAIHLGAWMNYTVISHFYQSRINNSIGKEIEDSNLLLKLLTFTDKSNMSMKIHTYKSTFGYRWSSRLNGVNGTYRFLTEEEVSANDIEKDIVTTIFLSRNNARY
jgi:hypothetical protein